MEYLSAFFTDTFSGEQSVFLIYLLILNVAAFFVYGLDKRAARLGKWRISEKTLLLLAALGGGLGAALGMKIFHHKTRKMKFLVLVPVCIAAYVCLTWWMFR